MNYWLMIKAGLLMQTRPMYDLLQDGGEEDGAQ